MSDYIFHLSIDTLRIPVRQNHGSANPTFWTTIASSCNLKLLPYRDLLITSCFFRCTYRYKPCLLVWLYTINPPLNLKCIISVLSLWANDPPDPSFSVSVSECLFFPQFFFTQVKSTQTVEPKQMEILEVCRSHGTGLFFHEYSFYKPGQQLYFHFPFLLYAPVCPSTCHSDKAT